MTKADSAAPAVPRPAPPVAPGGAAPRRRRRRLLLAVGVIVVLAVAAATWALRGRHDDAAATDRAAQSAAARFLADWVDPDGRVVRRDQGGDTVSEGQAYGMLLAVAAADRPRFDQIWAWTNTHLRQPSSLLAWRWANGAVTDDQSAADADLDAIWALSLAGARFHDVNATKAATKMAAAVLGGETVTTTSGLLLAAGPWARTNPATVNPSYLVAGTADALSDYTGDNRWRSLAAGTTALDTSLLAAHLLPPDWVDVRRGSAAAAARPVSAPGGGAGVQYGLDAPRLLIRLATSCNSNDRRLAAAARLAAAPNQPAIRSLTGNAQVQWRHPITDIAAAAVRDARGDSAGAAAAFASAQASETASPTYYGAAWVALGQTLLTTHLLTQCGKNTRPT